MPFYVLLLNMSSTGWQGTVLFVCEQNVTKVVGGFHEMWGIGQL